MERGRALANDRRPAAPPAGRPVGTVKIFEVDLSGKDSSPTVDDCIIPQTP